MLEAIGEMAAGVRVVPATELAQRAGSSVSANVVMIGCLAGSDLLSIPLDVFRQAVVTSFAADRLELNAKAFEAGVAAMTGT
jgi:Pyruvate/2-oxoacid:ferredoxin oxidoreductase gamma subunit